MMGQGVYSIAAKNGWLVHKGDISSFFTAIVSVKAAGVVPLDLLLWHIIKIYELSLSFWKCDCSVSFGEGLATPHPDPPH